jgi:serine/threonine protein kinase
MWSVGCILAEMLCGVPVFRGRKADDQLHAIFKITGTPSREVLDAIVDQCVSLILLVWGVVLFCALMFRIFPLHCSTECVLIPFGLINSQRSSDHSNFQNIQRSLGRR